MTILLVYLMQVVLFCLSFYFTKMLETCRQVLGIARDSIAVLSNRDMDDLEKEKAIQRAALGMTKHFIVLVLKIFIILAATVAPMWLADLLNMAAMSDTSQFALRWDVLAITTLVVLIPVVFLRRKA